MLDYTTFYGTALAVSASPPVNVPYQIAHIFDVFSELNLPNFQKVIENNNSIAVSSDATLDIVPASQGRYGLLNDSPTYYTWFHICTINTLPKKSISMELVGTSGYELLAVS